MPPYIGVAMNTRGPAATGPMSRLSSAVTRTVLGLGVQCHRNQVDTPQRLEQHPDEGLQRGRVGVGNPMLRQDAFNDLADRSTAVDVLHERQLSRVESHPRTRPDDLVAGEAAAVTEHRNVVQ